MEKKNFDRLAAAVSPTSVINKAQGEPAPKPLIPPTWSYWPGERMVDAMQAVALSLNIDPDCLEFTQFGHIKYLHDPETREDFVRRAKLIAMVPPHAAMLQLSQFAIKLGTLEMPAEMAALKLVAPDAKPVPIVKGEQPASDATKVYAGGTEQAGGTDKKQPTSGASVPHKKGEPWTEDERRKLLSDSNAGLTQQVLADIHGLTRQCISELIRKAKDAFEPKRKTDLLTNPLGTLVSFGNKK